MNKNTTGHTLKRFPLSRQFTFDVGRLGREKHHIKGLIEIDVTDSRSKIKRLRREKGAAISFTSWVLSCIARALSEHPEVQAFRKGKHRLVVFHEVDISMAVEKEVEGTLVPLPMIIRGADRKTSDQIFEEIEKAKAPAGDESRNFVLTEEGERLPSRFFALLPQWLRLIIWRLLLANPFRVKRLMGTCMVTFVGMMGNVSGWVIPYSIHPVAFALGSVVKKPGAKGREIGLREFFEVTVLIDHDAVDGAPAARFIARLKELMEKGYGLDR